ncbi:MAG: hypothetical protein HUU31_21670, partial [Anaerolineae bacterium]|nr:hypothetical protein [Anaerolineae bacterium]
NAGISGNSGATNGGGLFVTGSAAVILQNGAAVTQNSASSRGGGIFLTGSASQLNASGARLTYNTAGGSGDALFQANGTTTVTNACIVCNGDIAIDRSGGTSPMSLGGSWWGSAWGPYYATSTEGLQCSAGDSLNSARPLTVYGISVTTPAATCDSTPPVGSWLTAATAGCTGAEIAAPSGMGYGRTCFPP